MTTARQHLDWATERALEYYDEGDKTQATASFLSDVCKHPGTEWIARHPMTLVHIMGGVNGTREEFKYAMSGFNVSNQ